VTSKILPTHCQTVLTAHPKESAPLGVILALARYNSKEPWTGWHQYGNKAEIKYVPKYWMEIPNISKYELFLHKIAHPRNIDHA
jgi:hypothetical protein